MEPLPCSYLSPVSLYVPAADTLLDWRGMQLVVALLLARQTMVAGSVLPFGTCMLAGHACQAHQNNLIRDIHHKQIMLTFLSLVI